MELETNDIIEIFNLNALGWECVDVTHVLDIRDRPHQLVRWIGLGILTDEDKFIDLALTAASDNGNNRSICGKRKRVGPDDVSLRVTQAPRLSGLPHESAPSSQSSSSRSSSLVSSLHLSISHDSAASSSSSCSPSLLTSSLPSISPPSSPTLTDSPLPIHPNPPIASEVIDLTSELDVSYIGAPWPVGVFAQDMAVALAKMGEATGNILEERFADAFPAHKFVKGTFFKNRNAWRWSTQAERNAAQEAPRNADGLWTKWRAASSGWLKLRVHEGKGEGRRKGKDRA
jgi:hypothetical protein